MGPSFMVGSEVYMYFKTGLSGHLRSS